MNKMKRRGTIWFVLFLFLKTISVSAQTDRKKEIYFLIDTCITIMQKNSVNAGNSDWNTIRMNAFQKAAAINDPYELGPVIRYLYQSVNDFHGVFYYKDSTFRWERKKSEISDSIMNEWKKGVSVQSQMLDNFIGYLRIPYMSFDKKEEVDKKAQNLNDHLCSLLDKGIKGLIIDLRLNGGGAMYPMILGVEQLLGQGRVGSFPIKKSVDWLIKNNNFYLDTMLLTSIQPKCAVSAQQMPVVLLTSPATGSSGEFFIIAFKGRPNTILLGSPTAGYITSTEGFPINDAAFILLSTGYGADRNGKLYTEALQPDIPFEGVDKFNDIPNDPKVKAAVGWLKKR
jgi:C-terminal processing protease CtpA/Prc